MDIRERNITIAMARESLNAVPQHDFPAGFSLRWYRPGDSTVWRSIQNDADPDDTFDEGRFAVEFGTEAGAPGSGALNAAVLAERQCYLVGPDGREIGTATGWWGAEEPGRGRIHWVAIVPEFQGRGLSKPLLSAVLERLRHLGHEDAYLTTSSGRVVALRLYFGYGFTPWARSDEEVAAWRELAPYVGDDARQPTEEVVRRMTATAFHEAGHAVMAIALGRQIEKVSIAPAQLQTGGVRLGSCAIQKGRGTRSAKDRLEDEALILFAGMVAEAQYTAEYCEHGADQDLRAVRRLLRQRAASERQLARLESRLLDKTEHLLSDTAHAKAVELVAKELLKHQTISGRAVHYLIDQALKLR